MADAFGNTLSFGYNLREQLVVMADPGGGRTFYAYDTAIAENLASVTYPDGRVLKYVYAEPANLPFPRNEPGMVFDGHSILLFGGESGGGLFNDTWSLGSRGWSLRAPGRSPTPRSAMGMAYDSGHHQVVMFGGVGYANFGFHLNPLHSDHHSPFKDQYGKGPKGNYGHILQDLLYWLLHQHH